MTSRYPSGSSSSGGTWDPFAPSTVAVVLLSILVLQNAWRSAPRWLKQGISMGLASGSKDDKDDGQEETSTSKRSDADSLFNTTKDANDDLTNPMNLYTKLLKMSELARELCDGDPDQDDTDDNDDDNEGNNTTQQRWENMPWYKYYCCFMSLLHLQQELDYNYPTFRNELYSTQGAVPKKDEISILCHYLDFAHYAYLDDIVELQIKLRQMNVPNSDGGGRYELVRHDTTTEPGRVGHYMAVHHETKQVIIALKGTSTLGDILTDVLGKAIPHSIDKTGQTGEQTEQGEQEQMHIRCHEGMYIAAKMMLEDTLHILQHWIQPAGYSLIICGHSLGAAVSCLFGILIKQLMPQLQLHVYAYATPVCLSYQASLQCQEYITSVVNNHDIVPRMSLLNLRLLHRFFLLIDTKLIERGISPTNFTTATSYIKDLMTVDNDLLITPDEVKEFYNYHLIDNSEHKINEINEKLLDIELYIPGRVICLWNMDQQDKKEQEENEDEDKTISSNTSTNATTTTTTTTTNMDKDNTTATDATTSDQQQVGCRAHHGGMVVVRTIMVATDMISDHSCTKYRKNLQQLLLQAQQQE